MILHIYFFVSKKKRVKTRENVVYLLICNKKRLNQMMTFANFYTKNAKTAEYIAYLLICNLKSLIMRKCCFFSISI